MFPGYTYICIASLESAHEKSPPPQKQGPAQISGFVIFNAGVLSRPEPAPARLRQ